MSYRAPLLPSPTEQKAILNLLDNQPRLQEALTTLIGVPFDTMSKQEKLAALRAYINGGMAFAPIRMTSKILREVLSEADLAKETIEADIENARLSEQIDKLKRKNRKLKKQLAAALTPPPSEPLGHP